MSSQTVTLSIPEPLYTKIRERAERKNRSVEVEAVEVLATGMSVKEPGDTQSPDAPFPVIGTEAWGRMNQRRGALIRKKYQEGLTAEEEVEHERLQHHTGEALDNAFPQPFGDETQLDILEAKLRARSENAT